MNFTTVLKSATLLMLIGWQGLALAAVTAMLLDVKGKVSITHAGHTNAAQVATSLQEETKVELAAGSQVSLVHYATREQHTVAGPATVIVTPKGIDTVAGAPGQSRKLADAEAKVATNYRSRLVPGALNMRSVKPVAGWVYPGDGEMVLDPGRAFTWAPHDAKSKVLVKLFAGGQLLGEQIVAGNAVAPGRLGTLAPDMAYRVVASIGDDKPIAAQFTVARIEQRDALVAMKPKDQTSVEAWVLYAMALEADKVLSGAKEAWQVVARLRPEAAELVNGLAR